MKRVFHTLLSLLPNDKVRNQLVADPIQEPQYVTAQDAVAERSRNCPVMFVCYWRRVKAGSVKTYPRLRICRDSVSVLILILRVSE